MPQPWQIVNGRFDPYASPPNATANNQIAALQNQVDALTKANQMRAPTQPVQYTPSQQWQSQLNQAQSQGGLLNWGQPPSAPLQGGGFGQFGQPRQAPSLGLFNAQPINAQALSAKYLGKGTS